jgi:hypothetical protein
VVEDHGALLPQGAIGEVCLFDQPPDGLTKRTGELGRERKDGTIETLGRKDLTSVLNGARIATGQIEGFLNEVEGIDAAFVTVRSASSAGASMPTLVAWIVPETVPEEQDAASLSAAQETLIRRCRDHLKASLPEFMQPRILTMLDALPLDAEGRVAVAKLPEPDVRQLEKKEFVAPQRDIEVRLSARCCPSSASAFMTTFSRLAGRPCIAFSCNRRLRTHWGGRSRSPICLRIPRSPIWPSI